MDNNFLLNHYKHRFSENAKDLEYVSANGNPNNKTSLYLFISIFCLIFGGILAGLQTDVNFKNKSILLQKVIIIFRNIFFIITICCFLYYMYIHIFKYLPEYYEYIKDLGLNYTNPDGTPNWKISLLKHISIIYLVAGVFLLIKSFLPEFKNNTDILQKVTIISRNIFFIISVCCYLLYIYLYYIKYLPEYFKTFNFVNLNIII
jgi:hypothetical protein